MIRQRVAILIVIGLISAFMGFHARNIELSYDFPQVVPLSDPDYTYYRKFQKQFGEDGNLIIVGIEGKDVFHLDILRDWYQLGEKLNSVHGIDTAISISSLVSIEKNTELRKFKLNALFPHIPTSQDEADSIRARLKAMPFYKNLFYNDSTNATYMALRLERKVLFSSEREKLIEDVTRIADAFGQKHEVEVHYSGLPYIRTIYAHKLKDEINTFLGLSVLITSLILLLFFRGFNNVIFPLIIIALVMVWTMGLIVLLGYKLTLLTALIPPLIVIIGVPNFIYFVNSYHQEYRKHEQKVLAITRMVQSIAQVVFLNNATTAIGFGVMFFVDSPILTEFGVVAFLMICFTYFLMLVMLPIVFSYLPPPSPRNIRYLDNKLMNRFLRQIDYFGQKRRKVVLIAISCITLVSLVGISQLKALGYILDDVPKTDKLYTDLQFYERNFKGIMPFEIILDTHKKNGLLNLANLHKIEEVQDSLEALPEFSQTLSIVDVVKFARQSFYNGSVSRYGLPDVSEQIFLLPYLRGLKMKKGIGNALVDSTLEISRVSGKMADVGSLRLGKIERHLHKVLPKILEGSGISYRITGYSLIFLRGNHYLNLNLIYSLALAIALITIVIAWLFKSARLVVITLIPNFLALIITGGIMGFFHIYLKPSSVLVFSIAFGIAVDASFHFLVKYRLARAQLGGDISTALTNTLMETGFSIVYTSLILFFGFGIFCFSNFGSTIALGALTAITILSAMFTNIILIPALLTVFDKK